MTKEKPLKRKRRQLISGSFIYDEEEVAHAVERLKEYIDYKPLEIRGKPLIIPKKLNVKEVNEVLACLRKDILIKLDEIFGELK